MAEEKLTPSAIRGLILFAAFIYLAILFIGAIAKVVVIFAVIALLTIVLNPIVTWLESHKIPRSASAFSLALTLLGAIFLMVWLVAPAVIVDMRMLIARVPSLLDNLYEWLQRHFPDLAGRIPATSAELIEKGLERLAPLLGGLAGYALTLADVLVSTFVIFISTIYTLSSPRPLVQGFIALLRPKQRQDVIEAFQIIADQIKAWAFATLIAMLSIFIATWIILVLLGLKAAFLLALIAGVLEIVPVIGPLIAGVIAVMAALVQDPILALWVMLAFVGIQQLEGHILIPLVMSGRLQLHPVSVIFSVLVMGGLFGIVGIFLATPAAAVTKVLVYKFYIEQKTAPEGTEQEEISQKAEQIVSGADSHGATEKANSDETDSRADQSSYKD